MAGVGSREVAESTLELLLAESTNYFLYGHGSKLFRPLDNGDVEVESSDKDLATNASRRRLEAIGQDVGQRLVERYVQERDRLSTDLEVCFT